MAVAPLDMIVAKQALRAQLRIRRQRFVDGLAPEERLAAEARLTKGTLALLDSARCVAGYFAIGAECPVDKLFDTLAETGTITALPHVASRTSPMRFLRWLPGDPLETGWAGLLQPRPDAPETAPDVILAPMLGFDATLARIGQGAGFYDRAFAATPSARRIGIAWSVQQVDAVPTDPWDMRLHAIITEQHIFLADQQS